MSRKVRPSFSDTLLEDADSDVFILFDFDWKGLLIIIVAYIAEQVEHLGPRRDRKGLGKQS
jgi:hypothetical protein